ncbi:hypothetical protein Agub_g9861, partial [Astrephomene gubernaculifera]
MPGKAPASSGGAMVNRKHKRAKTDGVRDDAGAGAADPTSANATAAPRVKAQPFKKARKTPAMASQPDDAATANDATAAARAPARKKKRGNFWDKLSGWKEVEVGDDFLLGAEEGGFAGLEILDDPAVLDQYMLEGQPGAEESGDGGDFNDGDDGNDGDADVRQAEEAAAVDPVADAAAPKKEKTKKEKKPKKGKDVAAAAEAAGDGGEAAAEPAAAEAAAGEGAAVVDAAAAAAAAEERKRKQRERMKAKKARRKERRMQRLQGGEGGSASGDEGDGGASEDPDVAAAADGQEGAAAGAAAPPAKRRKQEPAAAAAAAAAEAPAAAASGGAAKPKPKQPQPQSKQQEEKKKPQQEKPQKAQQKQEPVDAEGQDDEEEEDAAASEEAEAATEEEAEAEEDHPTAVVEEEEEEEKEPVDMSAWEEFELHPSVVSGLQICGFGAPTPIQRECLHPAIRARADIIGAAQTGSGKTLAFGLPILHMLATERAAAEAAAEREQEEEEEGKEQEEGQEEQVHGSSEGDDGEVLTGTEEGEEERDEEMQTAEESEEQEEEEVEAAPAATATAGGKRVSKRQQRQQRQQQQRGKRGKKQQQQKKKKGKQQQRRQQQQQQAWPKPVPGPLRALILTPTRELAMQVCAHLQTIGRPCGVRVAAIVGGISDVKQARLLAARPAVLVATPGRLWDLMCRPPSTDRHGPAAAAHLANLTSLSFLVLDEADRMVAQGHYKELSNILDLLPHPTHAREVTEDPEFAELKAAKQQKQKQEAAAKEKQAGSEEEEQEEEEGGSGEGEQSEEADAMEEAEEEEEQQQQPEEEEEQEEEEQDEKKKGKGKAHLLQTFVFSATLTLPLFLKKRLRRGGGGAGGGAATLESLMDRVPFRTSPAPRVVDLTTERRIAERVTEAAVSCLEAERDEVLYYLLARHPGRTLVFANAVSAIRRLGALLKLLGLPVQPLHAQQQQRQRLKALDRFRSNDQAVLVATDVAARGLDIPGVTTVIHYQLPASADTYIHRCGRTARGVSGDGISIALVTPREAPRFAGLARVLGREPPPAFPVEAALMPQVRARVRLAMRLDDIERKERKNRAEDSWRRSNAKALGLDVSDDEQGGSGGSDSDGEGGGRRLRNGRQSRPSAEAVSLRQQLAALTAEPLAPKMNRRYFTGGLAAAVATRVKEPAAAPRPPSKAPAAGSTAEVPGAAAAAVPQAVALASRLQQSREAVAAATAEASKKRAKKTAAAKKAAAAGKGAPAGRKLDPRLIVSRNQLKKKHHRGMVVIPQAFGR